MMIQSQRRDGTDRESAQGVDPSSGPSPRDVSRPLLDGPRWCANKSTAGGAVPSVLSSPSMGGASPRISAERSGGGVTQQRTRASPESRLSAERVSICPNRTAIIA